MSVNTFRSQNALRFLNPLLMLVAAFNVALTLYCCTKFYAYLPTSDTWAYVDFLAQAAHGHLDIAQLFERHNGLHVIALPKLVYFFDMWLVQGSGALTVVVSLLAMTATTSMFVGVIVASSLLDKAEKIFLSLLCTTVLMSACQVESLLNPANLQWSLLVFSATLTAWFASCYENAKPLSGKNACHLAGVIAGVVLTGLTSASALLIIIPLALLFVPRPWLLRGAMILAGLVLLSMLITGIFFPEQFSLGLGLLKNWIAFTVDFLVPPVERLHSFVASLLAAIFVFLALNKLYRVMPFPLSNENRFFVLLLYFSLVTIVATGIVRSYSDDAFTFRFVNIGLLFAAALFPLLWLHAKNKLYLFAISVYVALLAYVNETEVSAFAYGRNHVRLTQVAYALNVDDPFVVATMPGSSFAQADFDAVQANKHFLQEAQAGIYGSEEYRHVGMSIDSLKDLASVACTTRLIKVRRLLPDQAAWRLWGESKTGVGGEVSRVYFVDEKNIIRGYAIPVVPEKNTLDNVFKPSQWVGFVNLDASAEQDALTLYGYNNHVLCQGDRIALPAYTASVKVNRYER
jgi:MFS family permease